MGGDQPLIHGKIEQPPAGFTCPYTQEVLILADLIATFQRDLLSWHIWNYRVVSTFADLFEQVLAGFDGSAGLKVNVAPVLL